MELTNSFEAAFQEAMAEIAEREETDESTPDPIEPLVPTSEDETEADASEEQAEEGDGEQSQSELEPEETESEESDELFADLEAPDEGEPTENDSEASSFTLPGIDEPVSLEELKDGYLRQADYTRKTQELAARRKTLDKAEQIHEALVNKPHEFARQLAVAAGLIEEGAAPVKVVELPFRSEEDIEAEIERRLNEAIESHPAIQEAQDFIALNWIESEFSRIEETYGQKLGPKSRELVLKTANANGTDNLELVFQALMAKQQEQARKKQDLKAAAPARPTGKATTAAVTEPPASFEDAALEAAKKLGIKLEI